jgi:hypothetical protein
MKECRQLTRLTVKLDEDGWRHEADEDEDEKKDDAAVDSEPLSV